MHKLTLKSDVAAKLQRALGILGVSETVFIAFDNPESQTGWRNSEEICEGKFVYLTFLPEGKDTEFIEMCIQLLEKANSTYARNAVGFEPKKD